MGPEDTLNLAFAATFKSSPPFTAWFVGQTKFSYVSQEAKILVEEQITARAAKFWWRHWWCFVPELNAESETDIFLAFEGGGRRFALHVENKLCGSAFQPNQAASYAARARHMLENTKSKMLRCTDFDTVLLAPDAFRAANKEQCALFGCFIAHEAIAAFIPAFAQTAIRPVVP